MAFYIRKVDSTQWEDELPVNHNILEMAVDGITNCCKTSGNTLSIWKTDSNDPADLENQKLLTGMAMALDRPVAFTYIFLSDDEIDSLALELQDSPGDTPFEEMASCHRDIANLTLEKMGELAWIIHSKVNDDAEMNIIAEEELSGYTRKFFPNASVLPIEKRNQKRWKRLYDTP